jgi:hypothetical protein
VTGKRPVHSALLTGLVSACHYSRRWGFPAYYNAACTYNHARSRKVPTTAYILALERKVENLKAEIEKLGKQEPVKKIEEPNVESKDEKEVKKAKSTPRILLETIVGAVRRHY